MTEGIVCALLGVVCIAIGVLNVMGNISTIHLHHRKRVSEENIRPFGRLVGAGTIVIGGGFILGGVFFALSELLQSNSCALVGGVIVIVGVVVGLVLSFTAMFKYNKGIF